MFSYEIKTILEDGTELIDEIFSDIDILEILKNNFINVTDKSSL